MTIMSPMDENELARMLLTAIDHDGPIALRYPRGKGQGVPIQENVRPVKIGCAQVVEEGDDLLIIAIGQSVFEAITAAKLLTEKKIFATVINARFVKPLDAELLLEKAAKIKKIITVEEHVLAGGFGSAVIEMYADKGITNLKFKRIGIDNKFVEHGPQDLLKKDYGVDSTAIVAAGLALTGNDLTNFDTHGIKKNGIKKSGIKKNA